MVRADKPPSKLPNPVVITPTVTSTIEREIKLAVDDHFRLPKLPGAPIPRRLLTSTYYDTAQYDLAHAGITLRHRIERGQQAWQLKLPLMKDRLEVELVNRETIPPASFRDLLFLTLGQRKLLPIATLRVWRAGVRVRGDHGPVADLTIDQVSVIKDGAVLQRFRELEIEQVNGKDDSLPDLERQLRRAGAEDHDGRPKLFRALSLAVPDPDPAPASDAHIPRTCRWRRRWGAADCRARAETDRRASSCYS